MEIINYHFLPSRIITFQTDLLFLLYPMMTLTFQVVLGQRDQVIDPPFRRRNQQFS